MKRLAKVLLLSSLPLLLGSASGSDLDRTKARFCWEIGHFVKGQDLVLNWHFRYTQCKSLIFYIGVTTSDYSSYYFYDQQSYDFSSLSGEVFDASYTIPGDYAQGEEIYLTYGVYGVQPGVGVNGDWADRNSFSESLCDPWEDTAIRGGNTFFEGPKTIYSGIYTYTVCQEKYVFSVTTPYPGDAKKRELAIEDFRILYLDGTTDYPDLTSYEVELRLLDHLDLFEAIGTRYGSGDTGFVSIPVDLVKISYKPYSVTYGIASKQSYLVSTSDFAIYPYSEELAKESEVPLFPSSRILCPKSHHYEAETFTYQLFLNNLNGRDAFFYECSVSFSENFFGNCKDAQYCVMLG